MAKQILAPTLTTTGYFSVNQVRETLIEALDDLEVFEFYSPRVTGNEPNSPNTIVVVLKKDQYGKTLPFFVHPVSNKIVSVKDGISA